MCAQFYWKFDLQKLSHQNNFKISSGIVELLRLQAILNSRWVARLIAIKSLAVALRSTCGLSCKQNFACTAAATLLTCSYVITSTTCKQLVLYLHEWWRHLFSVFRWKSEPSHKVALLTVKEPLLVEIAYWLWTVNPWQGLVTTRYKPLLLLLHCTVVCVWVATIK